MGTIYRKRCSACDADDRQNVTFEGFPGAVLHSGERGGDIISAEYLAYLAPNGELIPLPHPVEEPTLQEQGETWEHAVLNGRIIKIHNLICRDCGAMNTTASICSLTGTGCGLGIPLAVAAHVANVWHFKLPGALAYVLAWGALLLPSSMVWLYVRCRFGYKVRPFRSRHCAACQSQRMLSVARSVGKTLPCPKCGELSTTVTVAGMS